MPVHRRTFCTKGVFYDNGFSELNAFLAPEAGRIAMQETIMKFLVFFCGYSEAESDTVRRAIAKKKGTETLLPEIERRFIEYCSQHYEIDAAQCEKVIKPFIQIIVDASAYAFSWNHSDAYSAIGYICGYLRYYHPLEFLTAALNIFEDNTEKTADIAAYAQKVGISVTMPRWGISRSRYVFDKGRNVIAKGLTSVKYMNARIADELYDLSRQQQYTSFMMLLRDIDEKTTLNARQLDILIKLDFFIDFGNQRELLTMVDLFTNMFKRGQAKQIKKSEIDGSSLEEIISRHAVGVTKSGAASKSYTLLDVDEILKEVEQLVRDKKLKDLSTVVKVQNFYDVMGYIGYVTGVEADRRKLYVMQMAPRKRRKDGVQFGYSIRTKSIGSGKESCFTVFNDSFNKLPFKAGDVIYCKDWRRNGEYLDLLSYDMVYS